ncbi:MAG: glycosyltransferase [Actinomycetota bacterium]|nr:glycosyltransferase [Actinomycetota bacterium]MDP9303379.1 glycosyltransferase [Actinomycetota bacterium]
MPTLSVVIPATDGRVTLERVLAAVRRASAGPEELIVVDRPSQLGPGAARNVGARRANGDVLVFVDSDVEVHEDVFARIRSVFDDDPSLSAIFGSYDDEPGGGGVVSDFRNLLHHHVHHQSAGLVTTFWSGLGAIRRDVFLELEGFDERRDRAPFPRASVEDIELGMRLHARGGRIVLDPRIQGKHLKEWGLVSMITTDLLRRGVPWLRLVLENRSGTAALNLGWRNRLGIGASGLLVFALARRNVVLAGSTLALLIALDRRFYALLLRRRGPGCAAAGVPLHVIHRLASAAAVPIAVTDLLVEQFRKSSPA